MPIDVATIYEIRTRFFAQEEGTLPVEEPRSRIVRSEANGNVVTGRADTDNIATRRVLEVVIGLTGAANYVEDMLLTMRQKLNLLWFEMNVRRADGTDEDHR